MNVKRVRANSKDIKRIYFDAFQKKERMPFFLMILMSLLPNTDFLAFYEDERPVGFIYLGKNFRMVFIMFLAVDKSLHSKGYGTKILDFIKEKYPKKKILVSIEPCVSDADDIDVQERRRAFYARSGLVSSGYYMKLGCVQEILSNAKFCKREFRSFLAHYSNGTLWPKIWKAED